MARQSWRIQNIGACFLISLQPANSSCKIGVPVQIILSPGGQRKWKGKSSSRLSRRANPLRSETLRIDRVVRAPARVSPRIFDGTTHSSRSRNHSYRFRDILRRVPKPILKIGTDG